MSSASNRGPLPECAAQWQLDPEVVFLNHGSFGACPLPVLEAQTRLRQRMEHQPVRFLHRELEAELDAVRAELGNFLHVDAAGLCLVKNATTGVNTVLRSLTFKAGDRILVTDHAYNACRNALEFVAQRSGAKIDLVPIPFPLTSATEVSGAILAAASNRTRLALIDHVTSPTGLVLPIAEIVDRLKRCHIETLVDGAHAPGMLDLDLEQLGAAYYTGNCHKWLCSPKGSAFLHVRADLRQGIRPLVISHGANSPRQDRNRFLLESGWTGTDDPTALLCIPVAIRCMASLCKGGWAELRNRNRTMVLAGRKLLCAALEIPEPCPESMIGSLASLPLPEQAPGAGPRYEDPLQVALREKHGIEVPVIPWPDSPARLLRISAQIYNAPWQYQQLAQALCEEL